MDKRMSGGMMKDEVQKTAEKKARAMKPWMDQEENSMPMSRAKP